MAKIERNVEVEERVKPHIAIAGASGRFGYALYNLGNSDYRITSLVRRSNPEFAKRSIDGFDITNRDNVLKTVESLADNGVVSLINCVGLHTVDTSERERNGETGDSPMYRVHVNGTENIAHACRENGIKLVQLSTDYVFNGRKPFGEKYLEGEQPDRDPSSNPTWYGFTKALAENVVLGQYPEGSVIVRFGQVQGVSSGLFHATMQSLGENMPFTRVINQLVAPVLDATAVRAVSLIERALQLGESQPVYNINSLSASSPYELSLMLADAFGYGNKARELIKPVTLEDLVAAGEQQVVRPKNTVLAVTAFEAQFGEDVLYSAEEEIVRFRQLYGSKI